MNAASPSILLSWYTDPAAIPPFVLGKRQVTVGPKLNPGQPRMMFAGQTPIGVYDLKAALDIQRLPTRYDLVVVYADASDINCPLNLDAFGCPTVLVVGDTHHLQRPLQKVVAYAKDARFDFVVSLCNRHHLHWFRDAGFADVGWFPGLAIRHMPRPLAATRTRQVAFAGQSRLHPRRTRLIDTLREAGLALAAGTASREGSADRYAQSAVSFNASLNGDLNFRVFEVLSAGGCLLTDRLAPETGLDLLLREDTHYVGYDSADELIDKARELLDAPERAFAIARTGHEAYAGAMLPDKRAADLLRWALDGDLDEVYRAPPSRTAKDDAPVDLFDRLRVYERLQQLHLEKERPRALFEPGVPEIYRRDAADLRRLDIVTERPDGAHPTASDAVVFAGVEGVRCTVT